MDANSLASILNSSVVQWYYKKATVPKANGFFIYKVMFLKEVPIPELLEQQRKCLRDLGQIVAKCLYLGHEGMSYSQFLEDLIDACVMECYFHDHMAERNLLFFDDLLPSLDNFDQSVSDSQKFDFLEQFVATHNAPKAKVRNKLLRLTADSPDLLAVIKQEGKE
jgi:hypothetical protein